MIATPTSDVDPAILAFLRSLPPGTVVAQLDDGQLAVCANLAEAEQRFAEQQPPATAASHRNDRNWALATEMPD